MEKLIFIVVCLLGVVRLPSHAAKGSSAFMKSQDIDSNEYDALKELYDSVNGAAAGLNWNFTNQGDPCESSWEGLTCSDIEGTNHVTSLRLREKQLHGSLPASIGAFNHLSSFRMSVNFLHGTIPRSIGALSSLGSLYFERNSLSGTLPSEISGMKSLLILSLEVNLLTGPIPETIGALTHLILFSVDKNHLTGTIPESIGALTNLWIFTGQYNSLSGTIPTALSSLYNQIFFVILSHNCLSGTIPEYLSTMNRLLYWATSDNYLTGSLQAGLPETIYKLGVFDNYLTGTIPPSYGFFDSLVTLEISKNHLSGTMPASFACLQNIEHLIVSYNHLTGNMHDAFANCSLRDFASFNLTHLDVSANRLTGSLPAELFDNARSLDGLYAVKNCMLTTIPETICNLPNLRTFSINGIGSAEHCEGHRYLELPLMNRIELGSNGIVGTLPRCLFEMSTLETLQLTGNDIQDSLEDLEEIGHNLKHLALSRNQFRGHIPEVIQLHHWEVLDLSYNLFDGDLDHHIHPEVNSTWRLHINRLSGEVPHSFRELENVQILEGNIFQCHDMEHDLPEHDPDSQRYICGLHEINLLYEVWLCTFLSCLAMVLVAMLFSMKHDWKQGLYNLLMEGAWKPCKEATGSFYGKCAMLLRLELVILAAAILGLGMLYMVLSETNGKYEYLYVLSISAGFLSGVLPGVLILIAFALLMVLTYYVLRVHLSQRFYQTREAFENSPKEKMEQSKSNKDDDDDDDDDDTLSRFKSINSTASNIWQDRGTNTTTSISSLNGAFEGVGMNSIISKDGTATFELTPMSKSRSESTASSMSRSSVAHALYRGDNGIHLSTLRLSDMGRATCSEAAGIEVSPKTLRSYYVYLALATTLNLIIVILVNVGFGYVILYEDREIIEACIFLFAIFKLFWINQVTEFMLDFGQRRYFGEQSVHYMNRTSQFEVSFRNILTIGQMITIPCMVNAMISPTCFNHLDNPVVTEYAYQECYGNPGSVECLTTTDAMFNQISITPAFKYSYQCSGYLVRTLSPVYEEFLFLDGLIVPALTYIVEYSKPYRRFSEFMQNGFLQVVGKIFGDEIRNQVKSSFGHSSHAIRNMSKSQFAMGIKKIFNAEKFASEIITCTALLLTFGAAFPPLGMMVVITMIFLTYHNQLEYHKIIQETQESNRSLFAQLLDAQAIHIVAYLRRSVWVVISISCSFYTLFLIDTIGDDRTFEATIWAPLVVLLIPPVLWIIHSAYLTKVADSVTVAGVRTTLTERETASQYGLNEALKADLASRNSSLDEGTHNPIIDALTDMPKGDSTKQRHIHWGLAVAEDAVGDKDSAVDVGVADDDDDDDDDQVSPQSIAHAEELGNGNADGTSLPKEP